ncbi:MAG: hypothetical protein CBC48_00165 [bacterium TMED88]|nr:MAG: hypothetical protein CBC48_00165 [bacterium TMED88]
MHGGLGGPAAPAWEARPVHGERVGREQKNSLFSDICASRLGLTRRPFQVGSVLKPLGRVPIEARQASGGNGLKARRFAAMLPGEAAPAPSHGRDSQQPGVRGDVGPSTANESIPSGPNNPILDWSVDGHGVLGRTRERSGR